MIIVSDACKNSEEINISISFKANQSHNYIKICNRNKCVNQTNLTNLKETTKIKHISISGVTYILPLYYSEKCTYYSLNFTLLTHFKTTCMSKALARRITNPMFAKIDKPTQNGVISPKPT